MLYPKLQGFQQIVFGIDNWPITGAVSERIWTGTPIAMGHSRCHEDAVKIMNVSHSLRDFFIIIEAILGCDRGVRPSGILDHLASMMVERSEVGIGGIDDRRYRFARLFELLVNPFGQRRSVGEGGGRSVRVPYRPRTGTLLANGIGHVALTDWKSATADMKDPRKWRTSG